LFLDRGRNFWTVMALWTGCDCWWLPPAAVAGERVQHHAKPITAGLTEALIPEVPREHEIIAGPMHCGDLGSGV
jgi:hypothetical protein